MPKGIYEGNRGRPKGAKDKKPRINSRDAKKNLNIRIEEDLLKKAKKKAKSLKISFSDFVRDALENAL